MGGKSIVRTEPADSDNVRPLVTGALSKYPGSLNLDECDSGAEPSEALRFVLLLLIDLSEGGLEDLVDERRSGIMTTGIPHH